MAIETVIEEKSAEFVRLARSTRDTFDNCEFRIVYSLNGTYLNIGLSDYSYKVIFQDTIKVLRDNVPICDEASPKAALAGILRDYIKTIQQAIDALEVK